MLYFFVLYSLKEKKKKKKKTEKKKAKYADILLKNGGFFVSIFVLFGLCLFLVF